MSNLDDPRNIMEQQKVSTIIAQQDNGIDTQEQDKKAIHLFEQMLTTGMKSTFHDLNNETKMNNVAIFVDYDNVYWTLINYYNHDPDQQDPEKNLFIQLWNRYGLENVRTFRAYADFQLIKANLTSLQKKRIQIRHVYANGRKDEGRKNASDIELCMDAVESTYKDPDITCYVFVTADSDMIPVLSRMLYKGKRVELFYLSDAAPRHADLTWYAHYSEDLLHFIKVEVSRINLDDHKLNALKFIKEWQDKYSHANFFLGVSWLKTNLSRELGIPPNNCSALIEKLMIDGLIKQKQKTMGNGEPKQSIALTVEGENLLKK